MTRSINQSAVSLPDLVIISLIRRWVSSSPLPLVRRNADTMIGTLMMLEAV